MLQCQSLMRRGCETKENYYVVNFAKRNHVKKPCQNLIYNFVHHLKYRERENYSLTKLNRLVSPKEKVGTRSAPWRKASFTNPFLSLRISRISPPFGSGWFSTSLAPPTTRTAAVPLGPLEIWELDINVSGISDTLPQHKVTKRKSLVIFWLLYS